MDVDLEEESSDEDEVEDHLNGDGGMVEQDPPS